MRDIRVFVEAPLVAGAEFSAPATLAHYARNVLRLQTGDALQLFDGSGREFAASVAAAGKRELRILVGEELGALPESPLAVHLGLGLSRGERMDWALQKATELGVASITPLVLSRCNARLSEERSESRMRHWRQVLVSACEQCGRSRLPVLHDPSGLDAWLDAHAGMPGLVLHTRDAVRLETTAVPPREICVLTGPEGGLDDAEFAAARAAGFQAWSLGPRVLRAETAPAAALAILQHLWGDT